jgi:hypothetical protein
MDQPQRVERALQIVEGALELRGEAHRRYIEQRCAGDAELRREVESLLGYEGCKDVTMDPYSRPSDTSETKKSADDRNEKRHRGQP